VMVVCRLPSRGGLGEKDSRATATYRARGALQKALRTTRCMSSKLPAQVREENGYSTEEVRHKDVVLENKIRREWQCIIS
jgi:hypothetical protein